MTTEPVRAELVAQFLQGKPRYLELGLEVEAAVGYLRKKAKKDLWERMGKELELPAGRPGWELKHEQDRNSEGWVLHKQDGAWKSGIWSGVWVWRWKRDALNWVVGVLGWPESAAEFPRSARQAATDSFDRLGLVPWREDDNKHYDQIGWCVDGDQDARLLGGNDDEHVNQIVTLVSALLEVADSPTVPKCSE